MKKNVRSKTDVAHDVCPWLPYIAKSDSKENGNDEKNGD
jgi:hypothetical protein